MLWLDRSTLSGSYMPLISANRAEASSPWAALNARGRVYLDGFHWREVDHDAGVTHARAGGGRFYHPAPEAGDGARPGMPGDAIAEGMRRGRLGRHEDVEWHPRRLGRS